MRYQLILNPSQPKQRFLIVDTVFWEVVKTCSRKSTAKKHCTKYNIEACRYCGVSIQGGAPSAHCSLECAAFKEKRRNAGTEVLTDRQTEEEVTANATLWAAAPEMLTALRNIRDCNAGAGWQPTKIRRDAILAVTAAIDAATP